MMMDSQLLLHCDNAVYAEEIRLLLKTKGIDCFVHDEAKTEVIGSAGGNRVEIAIYVDRKDYDAALAIVNVINQKREEQMPWCPKCGSEDISKTVIPHQHGPVWLLFICLAVFVGCVVAVFINPGTVVIPGILWIILFIVWFKSYKIKRFTCKKCGHTFTRIQYTEEDKQDSSSESPMPSSTQSGERPEPVEEFVCNNTQFLLHCDNAVDAEEIRLLLQTKGIDCFVHDEAKTEVIGSAGGNRAEIAIYVDRKDYDAANAVVNEIYKEDNSNVESTEDDAQSDVVFEANEDEETVSARKMFSAPFSPIGRISRLEYVFSVAIYLVIDFLLSLSLGRQTQGFIVLSLILSAFFFMQGAKRCHDIGISGWWQVIPVVSWIWLLFAKGDEGKNEYGYPPYFAVEDEEGFIYTSAYLRANTQMSGGLIAFLVIMCAWAIFAIWNNYNSYVTDDFGNDKTIAILLFLPSILALVWICYVIFAFFRRLPNAVYLAEAYFVVLFLLNLVVKLFWNEYGYDWGSIIMQLCLFGMVFVYLVDSRNVATVIPRSFRRVSIFDIILTSLFFLLSIGAFAIGVNKVEALYQSYQELDEEQIVDFELEGEYTDGIVAFMLPDGFACEQESEQGGVVNVLTADSAYVVVYSGIDSDESEMNFNMNYCPNWEDKELKDLEQHEILNDRGELNGHTLFIQEKAYIVEDGVTFWRLFLFFDSASDKACVVSCYDNGNDDYLEPLLTSIRFK